MHFIFVIDTSHRSAAVNNELIRRALQKLTEEFLTPVEEYFSTLLPDER